MSRTPSKSGIALYCTSSNRHLAGGETIYGMHPILSMDELISEADEKRRADQYVIDILQSLINDDEVTLKAA